MSNFAVDYSSLVTDSESHSMTGTRMKRLGLWLNTWLYNDALPIWADYGVAPDGGFREALNDQQREAGEVRRSRVIGRQIYSFATAAQHGWTGPADRILSDALIFQAERMTLPNGAVKNTLSLEGVCIDDSALLYNQAFALFGAAAINQAAETIGCPDLAQSAHASALRLRALLLDAFRAPDGGFFAELGGSSTREANPHMHLLEACLAWEDAGGDAGWTALADEVAELALARMISSEGWLYEHFAPGWARLEDATGRTCEPGHHLEWAWLLVRWGQARNRPDALSRAAALVDRAEQHGVCATRQAAIMEVRDDGTILDSDARLWPQTERLKGHLALASVTEDPAARDRHLSSALEAGNTLMSYLQAAPAGLWRDRMDVHGTFTHQIAPASSLYHIVCAVVTLNSFLQTGRV